MKLAEKIYFILEEKMLDLNKLLQKVVIGAKAVVANREKIFHAATKNVVALCNHAQELLLDTVHGKCTYQCISCGNTREEVKEEPKETPPAPSTPTA